MKWMAAVVLTVIVGCCGTVQANEAESLFQEAVQAAQTAGGQVIEIPIGTFDLWAPVTVSGNSVAIRGQGTNTNLTDHISTGAAAIQFTASSAGSGNSLARLVLNAANTTGNGQKGILVHNQHSHFLDEVYIREPNGVDYDNGNYGCYVRYGDMSWYAASSGFAIRIAGNTARVGIDGTTFSSDATNHWQRAILINNCSGVVLQNLDAIHFFNGLEIVCSSFEANALIAINCYFDSSYNAGIYASVNGTGTGWGWQFINCWTSGGNAGTQVDGVYMEAPGGGKIDGVSFIGHRAQNNGGNGFEFNGANIKHLILADCKASGNSIGTPNTFNGAVFSNGISGFQIEGGIYGPSDIFTDIQAQGILISSAASDNFQVIGADVRGNVTSFNSLATGVNRVIANNLGIDTVVSTQASGATVALPVNPVVAITGTTAVTALTGGWTGRVVRLIKRDAGSVTVLGKTLASGGSLFLTYDGTTWY